jgi:hypothetical protein
LARVVPGLAAAFSIQAIAGAVRSTIEYASALDVAAQNAGISVEALQRWRFAGEQSGLTALQMDEAIRRLNRRLGLFVDQGGRARRGMRADHRRPSAMRRFSSRARRFLDRPFQRRGGAVMTAAAPAADQLTSMREARWRVSRARWGRSASGPQSSRQSAGVPHDFSAGNNRLAELWSGAKGMARDVPTVGPYTGWERVDERG